MQQYHGKQIVIVGLGETGESCINYFLKQGIVPKVMDKRTASQIATSLDPRIETHFGSLNLAWLLQADLIIVSPGVPLRTPELQQAKKQGIEIIGDIELFCREVNQQKNKKLVAITGSNGKTTVTTLVGEIAKQANIAVGVGGNISPPALTLLDHDYDLYVLELSSFQLESTFSLQADIATVLNISEDHLDRYPNGLEEYRQAKLKIYQHAACCLVNVDDLLTYPTQSLSSKTLTFGIAEGNYHLSADRSVLMAGEKNLFDCNRMQIIGTHNRLNALVALAIADYIQIPRQVTFDALEQFHGLDHRFQLVHVNRGVKWINDSKATNVGSTVAALKSLSCIGTLHLLLGGDGKGADFSELVPYLQKNIRLYCFGRDREQLATLNPAVTKTMVTMDEAMHCAAAHLHEGDVVLLSPACASLDQFKNYIHRGNEFTRLAKEIG